MAMNSGFFNSVENNGSYDREYGAAFFTALMKATFKDGITPGSFVASAGSGLTVNLTAGKGFVDGVFFYDDSLAGAVYGIYKGDTLIDRYTTDKDGKFTTSYYTCDTDWTLREISAPVGYTLDKTVYNIGSDPKLFTLTQNTVNMEVKETAAKGNIAIIKHTDDGSTGIETPEKGAKFQIYLKSAGSFDAAKTAEKDTLICDKNGYAKSKDLPYGLYTVHQVSGWEGRELIADFDVFIKDNSETYSFLINNANFRSFLRVVKKDSETGKTIPYAGAGFQIYNPSGKRITMKLTYLPIGNYYVKEIAANSAYVIGNTKFPVNFAYAGQEKATVSLKVNDGNSIANKIIYGSVRGKKTDEDRKELGGAVIGIFKVGTEKYTEKTAIQTATSAEDGSFGFDKVPYGTWIVREIAAPTGFVLSEEEFPVTVGKAEQVIEISMVNRFIKGNIALTKVDADYPENKLTGAEFEVFSDTDNDGELGENDLLLGLMAEGERGCYRMDELRYGRYFVREKTAPVGFVLDTKVYEVFITENGVTYFIQNKAGVGFINNAQKGSLKIQKRSTDKKVKGFSFRVTGDNGYDQVFKTDKNGEIFIEGLRIGEYRVSEISDKVSAPYILPADETVDIKYNETATVEMLNKNRDTPKTGDDFNSALWIGGAVSALAGAAALLFFGLRKRKKAE